MRRENSDFKTVFLSEAGAQLENRDYFGYVELDDFACWVMADGIDECENKMSAQMLVEDVLESFREKPGMSKRHLRRYIKDAHNLLKRESTKIRLKASVIIVVSDYITMSWASTGNVHLQVFSEKKIKYESEDQSYYQNQVKAGAYPQDQSIGFEERNNLTCYAGTVASFQPFISKKHKLAETDTVLLSTVGFWEHVQGIEVLDALEGVEEPQEAADNLEDLLLSKQPDSLQNYSMAVIFVNKLFLQEKKWWPRIKKGLIIAIPILLMLAVMGGLYYRNQQKRSDLIAQIEAYEKKGDFYIDDDNYSRALEQYNEAVQLKKDVKRYENEPLMLKQQASEYISDGKNSLEKGELEEANTYYTKARDLIIDYPKELESFQSDYILEQLDLINTKIYIRDLTALADSQAAAGQYNQAIENYLKAKNKAIDIGDTKAVQAIDVKLEKSQSDQDSATAGTAAAEADAAAANADDQASSLNPSKAAGLYDEVANQYEAAGNYEKAAQMRQKASDLRTQEKEEEEQRQKQLALDFTRKGDEALAFGDYGGALAYYDAALGIYTDLDDSSNTYTINQKITTVNNLMQQAQNVSAESFVEQ